VKNPDLRSIAMPAAAFFILSMCCLAQESTPATASQSGDAVLHDLVSQVRELHAAIEQMRAENVQSRAEMHELRQELEETRKLLGRVDSDHIEMADFTMAAHCNRVAVEDGHTESVSLKLKRKASAEEIIAALNQFRSTPQELKLPLAPEQPIVYDPAPDRPQPRFDVDRGNGMTVSVGRLRPCGVLDWKFTVLSHNTIRGAAGAALLNAELLKVQGLLPGVLEPHPVGAHRSDRP